MDKSSKPSELYQRIWKIINQIPEGKVATYGQIARIAGLESNARIVGYALHSLPEGADVPWHRVINSGGRISLRKDNEYYHIQKALLENENIVFNNEKIDFKLYGWLL